MDFFNKYKDLFGLPQVSMSINRTLTFPPRVLESTMNSSLKKIISLLRLKSTPSMENFAN